MCLDGLMRFYNRKEMIIKQKKKEKMVLAEKKLKIRLESKNPPRSEVNVENMMTGPHWRLETRLWTFTCPLDQQGILKISPRVKMWLCVCFT